MRPLIAFCSALAVLLLALAASAAPPPAEGPKPLPPEEVRGLMLLLQETMAGQPVVAVGTGNWDAKTPKAALEKADSMVGKLQALAEAAGRDEDPLIPYAIRKTWVLAPETRDEVNTGLNLSSPLDAAARSFLIQRFFARLTPGTVKSLGSRQGVLLADLPADVRDPLVRALHPPLVIERIGKKKIDIGGREIEALDAAILERIDAPLDPKRVRIRMHLSPVGPRFDLGKNIQAGFEYDSAPPLRVRPAGDGLPGIGPVDLPVLASVPNTYKPSDLEGKTFTQPIGLSGAWKLSDVLDRAGKVTGLRLITSETFGFRPVFLGREDIPVGDVLDGVRLALTAAWRKMGDTYVLAWDKRGLGALQQEMSDAVFTARQELDKMANEDDGASGWIALAEGLPFAPDDPLAPTEGQRRELLDAESDSYDTMPRIPFTRMRPDQQDATRTRAQSARLSIYSPGSGFDSRMPTEEDIQKTYLQFVCSVEISLDLPGHGWVQAEQINRRALSAAQVASARAKAAGKSPERYVGWEEDQKRLDSVKPQPVPAAFRALAVPALSPAQVADVVEKMRRHGLNVLFYPVLFGGYATFPTNAFPLHPALRGQDGWAAAEAATKSAGIRLIGTIETLAWQRQGDRAHWLNRHPEWLDVDRTGTPRLTWLGAHPDFDPAHLHLGTLANYVRPSEPEVEKRLTALVTAFAAKRGAAGLALSDWEPGSGAEFVSSRRPLPALGFSMPDRLTAVHNHGSDPIDAPALDERHEAPFTPRAFRDYGQAQEEESGKSAGALIAERLLARAKSLRPDWTTWLLDDSTNLFSDGWERKMRRFPKADVILSTDERRGGTPVDDRIEKFRPLREPLNPKKRPPMVYVTWYWSEFQKDAATKGRILLDLRDAPERLDEVLAWITAR